MKKTNWIQYFENIKKSVLPEEENIQQQSSRMTNYHVGAAPAVATTTDRKDRGQDWHEEEDETAKSLRFYSYIINVNNDAIKKSLSTSRSHSEYGKFATSVLKKSQAQVNNPSFDLTPKEKLMYKSWLIQKMSNKSHNLRNWMNKK